MSYALAIVDVETTGLSPTDSATIEVGAVLYSTEFRRAEINFSTLLRHDSNAAARINRIGVDSLLAAPCAQFAWNRLSEIIDIADCLVLDHGHEKAVYVAHRAEFDRGFIAASAPRLAERLPWVCSKFDIEWPLSSPGDHLVNVALAHGVPVHENHEALTDCRLLVNTFKRVAELGHDVDKMIANAMIPRSLFAVADTSFDEARNAKAKALGFAWNSKERRWEKRMTTEASVTMPFEVRQVA